ncbi:phage exclusion protein Lit family protein [Sabulicella glaciei]|uniref:Phage exclusion protein Lit family protein n=1 Tax=Sabulicella glaciei TaxID=2984948 RepID=A0ABT3P0K5_9PROT|nr:phage exclusion protein Lit family protein [Roseococcus sp. MDT2-1-1]MCW8087713.1 phage exclusion protein Lit family protein [Roseococcus sp. MDT2-1-1]
MSEGQVTPRQAVIALMKGAVPERADDIDSLWARYDPDVVLSDDSRHITLNACKERITVSAKTMDVFWLIGFSGWRAIECYSPHVVISAAGGGTVADLMRADEELGEVERAYKERIAAVQDLIAAPDATSSPWPPDLPRPSADREAMEDMQYKSAFDLSCLAAAFTYFHEFRHVMLDRDNERPGDLREEEMACDVWARSFLTAHLAQYALKNGHIYQDVLRKRSMGLAVAALILHEITPLWEQGGNCQYFSLADRLHALLDNTPLPANDHFWIFAASLLIGILRQRHIAINAPQSGARELALYLLAKP